MRFKIIILATILCITFSAIGDQFWDLVLSYDEAYIKYRFDEANLAIYKYIIYDTQDEIFIEKLKFELALFADEQIDEEDLNRFYKITDKAIKKDKSDFPDNLKFLYNSVKFIEYTSLFKSRNLEKFNELLSNMKDTEEQLELSANLNAAYANTLFINGYSERGEEVLNRVFKDRDMSIREANIVVTTIKSMNRYYNGKYAEMIEKLENLKVETIEETYFPYVPTATQLWLSLAYYKSGNHNEAIIAYTKYVKMKNEVDTKLDYIVPEKFMICPVPGVFPPYVVYEDYSNLRQLASP